VTVAIDVHQHLWPEALMAALARRRRPPMLRRAGRAWMLRVSGEPEWPVDPADHDPARRARLMEADSLDRAVVALSSPLGIEALPADEAAELLDAYHAGVAELPPQLASWAAAGLAEPDPAGLAARLDRGRVGLCLPALALAGPEGVARCAPLLSLLEERGLPLLVHPGPASWLPSPAPGPGDPSWWPALTSYVAQMQAAWLAFRAWVRPAHPRLRACFAMLAGLAPLHAERLASRGVHLAAGDPGVFLDTSSYGPAAVGAVAAAVGPEALVHGSDRPVLVPAPVTAARARTDPARVGNPARLLSPTEVAA
jgi:6-methylsalicylate decarboxylase